MAQQGGPERPPRQQGQSLGRGEGTPHRWDQHESTAGQPPHEPDGGEFVSRPPFVCSGGLASPQLCEPHPKATGHFRPACSHRWPPGPALLPALAAAQGSQQPERLLAKGQAGSVGPLRGTEGTQAPASPAAWIGEGLPDALWFGGRALCWRSNKQPICGQRAAS